MTPATNGHRGPAAVAMTSVWRTRDGDVPGARVVWSFRLWLAFVVLAGSFFVPDVRPDERRSLLVLLGLIWVGLAAGGLLLGGRLEHWPARMAALVGDLLGVFMLQVLFPSLSYPVLFGAAIVVAFYAHASGRVAGLMASVGATGLTAWAWTLSPPVARRDVLALAVFASVLVFLTLLLDRAARAERRRAQELGAASPLTGLPGNVRIDEELRNRLERGEKLALLHLDLDQFKAFNDRYGFLRGDAAINLLARLLVEAAAGHPGTFVGHIGGDDFVAVTRPESLDALSQTVIDTFERERLVLYDPDDAARGHVEVVDRRGVARRYPLLSISIGAATNLWRDFRDHRELVEAATEMKLYAKSGAGGRVAVDRRRSPS
jgi:diguanylate cyclase (GGDEF)-like protein